MAIQRRSSTPAGITNASGQPEIVLEIDGLTISMTPPGGAANVPEPDLERFVDAQGDDLPQALAEIEAGRKRSHWMWYVFPQVSGLGQSAMSKRYAIETVAEAEAYLTHPVLGAGYRQLVDAVWHQVVGHGATINGLFGSPDDTKLVSSLTLFAGVARGLDPAQPALDTLVTRADEILHAAYVQGLAHCATTERFLAR